MNELVFFFFVCLNKLNKKSLCRPIIIDKERYSSMNYEEKYGTKYFS